MLPEGPFPTNAFTQSRTLMVSHQNRERKEKSWGIIVWGNKTDSDLLEDTRLPEKPRPGKWFT